MSVVVWISPEDCDPPHGLDMWSPHDHDKVWLLVDAFQRERGFDKRCPAIIAYAKDGRIQLLSGTHRHRAAIHARVKIPVVFWLGSDVDKAWGELEEWKRIMEDIPVAELETWTRDDIEARRRK